MDKDACTWKLAVCGITLAFLTAGTARAGTFTYTNLTLPGGSSSMVNGINDSDQAVGTGTNVGTASHGFIWSNGQYTQVDVPGTIGGTIMIAINNNGIALGGLKSHLKFTKVITYNLATGKYAKFTTKISHPGGINVAGEVAGYSSSHKIDYGVVGTPQQTTTLNEAPGVSTFAFGIADDGTVAGAYLTPFPADRSRTTYVGNGFTYKNGVFTTVNYPGYDQTVINVISSNGEVGGSYSNVPSGGGEFVESGGVFTNITYPGAFITEIGGINSGGEVVGWWSMTDSSAQQGFIDVGGNYYNINPPGSVGTVITGVNAKGSLVGFYQTALNGAYHGFIAQCAPNQVPCTQ